MGSRCLCCIPTLASPPSPWNRPAMTASLEDLDAGRGDVLMVAKLDRLTRSVPDASGLMQRSEKSGWAGGARRSR